MKWLFGQPARGHWKLPKPFRKILRGLAMSEKKDHRLILAAKAGVSPELTPGVSQEPALEASLEIMPEPTVKVAPMMTYSVCILSPPTNLLSGGE